MPERTFSSPDYRYGFNGKEKDEEGEWGSLTHYDYGFRIYNPGVGRFLSVDPLTKSYPWYTPYQFAGNMPILAIDIDGREPDPMWKVEEGKGYAILVVVSENEPKVMHKILAEKNINIGINVIKPAPDGTEIYKLEKQWFSNVRYRSPANIQSSMIGLVERDFENAFDEIEPLPSRNLALVNEPTRDYTFPIEQVKKSLPAKKNKLKTKTKPKEYATPPPPLVTPPIKEPSVVSIRLDVPFVSNRARFRSESRTTEVLDPILKSLKADPRNSVTLRPNTAYSKGFDISDFWGLTGDGDKSEDLVEKRGELIKKWFMERGVSEEQINIIIDDKNFDSSIDVSGELLKYEKSGG